MKKESVLLQRRIILAQLNSSDVMEMRRHVEPQLGTTNSALEAESFPVKLPTLPR
jgi:hypothetical protein